MGTDSSSGTGFFEPAESGRICAANVRQRQKKSGDFQRDGTAGNRSEQSAGE